MTLTSGDVAVITPQSVFRNPLTPQSTHSAILFLLYLLTPQSPHTEILSLRNSLTPQSSHTVTPQFAHSAILLHSHSAILSLPIPLTPPICSFLGIHDTCHQSPLSSRHSSCFKWWQTSFKFVFGWYGCVHGVFGWGVHVHTHPNTSPIVFTSSCIICSS
jgi:hypothetical protein